jgi:purine catabolism regulator
MSLAKNEEIRQIAEATVAPLHHYSVERGIDLMKTVRTYNECKGNVSQTSRELNLHRQSLLYRLKKIESLTSCDLNNSDDLFLIELSIRLHTAGALFVTDERTPHV